MITSFHARMRRVVVETALFCGLETEITSERGARETHYVVMRKFLQIPKLRLIKALKQLNRFQADRTVKLCSLPMISVLKAD